MTADEAQRIKALTARMTTRCIGRHLIDLPERFVLNPVWQARIDGVDVSVQPMDEVLFQAALQGRTHQLQRESIHAEQGNPSLREVRVLSDPVGRAFNRAETGAVASDRTWEIWAWRDGFVIKLAINAYDKQLAYRVTEGLESDVEEKFAQAIAVLRRIHGRHEDQIPQEPGDCFAHGLWLGPQAENAEFYMNYHLRDAPDVYINLSSVSGEDGPRPETGLMQRRADIERQAKHAGIEFLRFTTRQLHGVAYEESIGREPKEVTGARVPGHTAILQTDQAAQGRQTPFVAVEMFNGHYIPWPERSLEEAAKVPELQRATLSEAEVIALWDAITATLRPRPGAF